MTLDKKIGVLCSAGGSAVFAAYDMCEQAELIRAENIFVLTDRACGAEGLADARGVARARVSEEDRERFSIAAARRFLDAGCDLVLMFFNRLVSADLYERLLTLNVHPALLPSFKGMVAVRRARDSGAGTLGATLHVADERVDGGPIVAQIASPMAAQSDLAQWNRVSFIQKTYLSVFLMETLALGRFRREAKGAALLSQEGAQPPALVSPALQRAFADFQEGLGLQAVAA